MDIFVARQPIFNQHREVYAYELLFRSGFENAFGNVNGDQASSQVMTNSFLGIGLETLTGGKRAFVNFTRDLLVDEMALLFPSEQLVVEILENVEPDEEVLDSCRRLKQAGYSLALDDFCFERNYESLLKLADLIKVDFLSTTSKERCEKSQQLTDQRITLLAEKVETQEDFEEAVRLGYTYFQGYFFSKPVVVSQRGIPGFEVPYIQILQSVRRPEIDFAELERIIKSDLSLTQQLLVPVNGDMPPVKGRPRKLQCKPWKNKSGGELASARSCFSTVRTALGKLRGLAGPVRYRSFVEIEFSTVPTAPATSRLY